MAQLRQRHDEFARRGAAVVAVNPHDVSTVRRFWAEQALPFVGLADEDGQARKLYGQPWRLLKMGRMPSLVIIDREGHIRFVTQGRSMEDIPSTDDVLAVLDSLEDPSGDAQQ